MSTDQTFLLAGNQILPIIEEMQKVAQQKLLASYANGQKDLLSEVSELAALTKLSDRIKRKMNDIEAQIEAQRKEQQRGN